MPPFCNAQPRKNPDKSKKAQKKLWTFIPCSPQKHLQWSKILVKYYFLRIPPKLRHNHRKAANQAPFQKKIRKNNLCVSSKSCQIHLCFQSFISYNIRLKNVFVKIRKIKRYIFLIKNRVNHNVLCYNFHTR